MIPFSCAAASPSAIWSDPVRGAAHREGALDEVRPQVRALEELGHGVGDARFLADVENRENVRVREGRDRAGLSRKTRTGVAVCGQRLGQGLDRDLAAEPAVTGSPDLPHPARAERREDFVGPETGAAGQRHVVPGF